MNILNLRNVLSKIVQGGKTMFRPLPKPKAKKNDRK